MRQETCGPVRHIAQDQATEGGRGINRYKQEVRDSGGKGSKRNAERKTMGKIEGKDENRGNKVCQYEPVSTNSRCYLCVHVFAPVNKEKKMYVSGEHADLREKKKHRWLEKK